MKRCICFVAVLVASIVLVGVVLNSKVRSLRRTASGTCSVSYFAAHAGGVRSVAISPDGMLLASVGEDRRLTIRSAKDPEAIMLAFGPFGEPFHCVAFSQKGDKVAAAGDYKEYAVLTVSLANRSRESLTIPAFGTICALYYCGEDSRLACFDASNELLFFDPMLRRVVGSSTVFGGFMGAIAASPDRRYFAVASQNEVDGWSAEPSRLTVFDEQGE